MGTIFQYLFKYKWFLFQKGKLSFESVLPGWMLFVVILACGGAVALAYYNLISTAKGKGLSWRRMPLPFLRVSVLLCLMFARLRPSLHVSTLLPRENIAALLFDDSASMSIQDAAGTSRLNAL